jgi:hypothetical protein
MTITRRKFLPAAFGLLASAVAGCYTRRRYYYYDDVYPTTYGTYTVVRRPVRIVDPWAARALRRRRYRRYYIRRHNSPEIVYTATHENRTLEVKLTPQGDNTRVEVTARNGENSWDSEEARVLMSDILENGR